MSATSVLRRCLRQHFSGTLRDLSVVAVRAILKQGVWSSRDGLRSLTNNRVIVWRVSALFIHRGNVSFSYCWTTKVFNVATATWSQAINLVKHVKKMLVSLQHGISIKICQGRATPVSRSSRGRMGWHVGWWCLYLSVLLVLCEIQAQHPYYSFTASNKQKGLNDVRSCVQY
jgi:hypothetical protein